MAAHKNQHFVPRCHLREFSVGRSGKAINVYNLHADRVIRNAPLKGQCAKAYFYGKDLIFEKRLQPIEGRYALVVENLIRGQSLHAVELAFLRDFCYLQYVRTDFAARRVVLSQTEMVNLAFERDEAGKPPPFTVEEAVRESLRIFSETRALIADLKTCIVRNKTKIPFVTSDDPAVLMNRFYTQRLGPTAGSAGTTNSGAMFVLPLSPEYAVVAYDGDVYTVPDKRRYMVDVLKDDDVTSINILQFMKAQENIYFSDWSQAEGIRVGFRAASPRRPNTWHATHFAVLEEEVENTTHKTYRVVHTAEERLQASEALIHIEALMLDPGIWCSKIQFRAKPAFVDTHTGRGFVRRAHRNL